MPVFNWSQTPASNSTADPTINYAEGQAPSTLNDSGRAMMAALAKYRDDISGSITTGGTSTAYTVTSNSGFDTLAHLHNQIIAFVPNATSTNAVGVDVTLNVDSLGAKPLRGQPSVALPTGTLVQGTPYIATYNNTDGAFYLHGLTNQYNIPLAAGMDYWGSTTPNSCFAFPTGQAISRTTYATLFSLLGTTYGTGDGSTTFNLPDKTGRISAMKEASATRLTSTYFGGNSTNLGATGGAEKETLITANMPAITPSGTITDTRTWGVTSANGSGLGDQGARSDLTQFQALAIGAGTAVTPVVTVTAGSISFSGNSIGTSSPVTTVQPTIICNYILRII